MMGLVLVTGSPDSKALPTGATNTRNVEDDMSVVMTVMLVNLNENEKK